MDLVDAQIEIGLSRVVPGLRGRSSVYIDDRGFAYYQHSTRRGIRYITKYFILYNIPTYLYDTPLILIIKCKIN